ncbi:MAG TPA: subclass B3 metallo-beta-lactamase [Vicinamibacteria bacterium]|jgi:metallo-beta-lactamase class B|nr:subclass B3 metallo-beta-lactamase [Vicinamibacteria bacterium]
MRRCAVFLMLTAPLVGAQSTETFRAMNRPVAPYRILGNLYSVGASDITSFLVATPEGHILINGGFVETVPQIQENVRALGFRLEDVKVLLLSHAHFDHAAGIPRLKELTGARVLVMEGDDGVFAAGGKGDYLFGEKYFWAPCPVDKVLHDGEKVLLGGATLTALRTPGHTPGCTTWTMDVEDGEKTRQVVILGSVSINPGTHLLVKPSYSGIAEDYAKAFRVLKGLSGEVFLASHASLYGAEEKARRLRAGATPNPFIDPVGYRTAVNRAEQVYLEQLERERGEAAVGGPAGSVHADVPATIDPRARYVIYLHGRILEEQGRHAVSPDFGPYAYDAILAALAERGFTVISEVRNGESGLPFATRVAGQVRALLKAGVPVERVTLLGASKGGFLALAAAAELGEDGLNVVVLGSCGGASEGLAPRLRGRLLSIYDEVDRFHPSCRETFARAPQLKAAKEVVLKLGLDHGLLYTPRKEWLDPATGWAPP